MRMILAVMYREYRIRTTSLTWTFYDLIMPLVYLLLFGVGLDRAFAGGLSTHGSTVSYNAFFLSGVLSMACFGIAINTAYGFFLDRDNGIFYEFLTYPMTRGQFLVGKILFNCLLSLVQALLTIVLGSLILQIPLQWNMVGIILAGVVIGTAGWFFFLTTFALRIRRNDMFNTFLNVAYFMLMFASSMFYPLEGMPQWLRTISTVNPLTWHTDVLRFSTIGIGTMNVILLEAVAFALFLLVSFWFAVRTVKYSILK
jgi:ABC-2 type transport system permease protein